MKKSNLNKVKKHFLFDSRVFLTILSCLLGITFLFINLSIFQLLCIDTNLFFHSSWLPDISIYYSFSIKSLYEPFSMLTITIIHYVDERHELTGHRIIVMLNQIVAMFLVVLNLILKSYLILNPYVEPIISTINETLPQIIVHMDGYISNYNYLKNDILFYPLQHQIITNIGQPTAIFFRLVNLSELPITLTSIYNIFPHENTAHIYKIQCFCYEQIHLLPGQSVTLPVLFEVGPNFIFETGYNNSICLQYVLMLSS